MKKIKNAKKMCVMLAAFFCLALFLGKTDVWAARYVELTKNKWYKDNNSLFCNQSVYHKIKVKKTGCVIIDGYGYSTKAGKGKFDLDIRICASDKKPLQTENIKLTKSNNYRAYVGLKKGNYYIRVMDSLYKLKYGFKEISDKSGANLAKAKRLVQGETMQGLLLLGENGKKTDWYKFWLPQKRKVAFTFGARSNKHIEFKIYSQSIRIEGGSLYRLNSTKTSKTVIEMPKGIYYIQVRRQGNNRNASGFYSVKWK